MRPGDGVAIMLFFGAIAVVGVCALATIVLVLGWGAYVLLGGGA